MSMLLSGVLVSPSAVGIAIVVLIFSLFEIMAAVAIVAAGVTVFRKTRGPLRDAVVPAAIAGACVVASWDGTIGIMPGIFQFASIIEFFAAATFPVAAVAALAYPVVWGYQVLRHPSPSWARALGCVVLAAGAFGLGHIVYVEANFAIARATGHPRAFRSLIRESERCPALFTDTWLLLRSRNIAEWIAANPATPPDVLAGLLSSTDLSAQSAARRNPSLPVAVVLAPSGLTTVHGRNIAALDPRTPTDTLESLARQYPDVRVALATNYDYLYRRASASTLRLLSADSLPWIRADVARSPLTPEDVRAVLARDTSELVRQSLAHRVR
jgi:hypothetical protein